MSMTDIPECGCGDCEETAELVIEGLYQERARVVAWLRERGLTASAASIEAGEHWGDE